MLHMRGTVAELTPPPCHLSLVYNGEAILLAGKCLQQFTQAREKKYGLFR